jgi:hypothetical protein
MFADDFAGVAGSANGLQAIVDRAFAHYQAWRMKASIPKLRVMVVRGKGAAARSAAPLEIRWGGPTGERIDQIDAYTYMGVTLHSSCKWDAQIERAKVKTWGKANSLASLLRPRGASANLKRLASIVLLRPTTEWGAGVWRPNRSDMPRLDSLQADLLKSCFHCPATICHSTLLLELGLRPMSLWGDKRLLEFWHRVRTMPESRLVKQVVLGAGTGTQAAGRRRGPRQHTWLDHVGEALQEWGIDPSRTERMNYPKFKRLLHKTLPVVWARRLEAERASRPTLDAYMSRFATQPVQFTSPKAYLCGAGACNRGKELVLQLRTNSLPLASLTGKFGRSRRDDPTDTSRSMCPVCSSAVESVAHFLLDCPAYSQVRADVMQKLQDTLGPAEWQALQQRQAEDRAYALLDDTFCSKLFCW